MFAPRALSALVRPFRPQRSVAAIKSFGPAAAWALVLLALVCATAGCDSQPAAQNSPQETSGLKRVILLNNGADPYWDAMLAGMQAAEKDFDLKSAGLRVVMDVNDASAKGQIDKLRQYANQTDIAAVAISVTDSKNPQIPEAMRELQKTGVKVIAIDSDIDRQTSRDARFAYLGTDNVIAGEELGKAAKALRPGGGKFAAFVGLKSAANAIERIEGFRAGAGDKFVLAEALSDDFDHGVALKNVKDALDRNPDLTTLLGVYAYNAAPIAETVQSRKLKADTTVVVFDGAELAIAGMQDGLIDAMLLQKPYEMGYVGTQLMKALVTKDYETVRKIYPSFDEAEMTFTKASGDILITGLRVVVPDTGSPLKKEMFGPDTEFITLSELKDWLVKNKLKGT
jgi:ribose transport system substrate-binding protein